MATWLHCSHSTACWKREGTQRFSGHADSASALMSHQVRTTSQGHLGHDHICNPYRFSLPQYITGSNFRDKLLKVLHCCTEKTGFIHFIDSIGKILEHQFNQATERKKILWEKGILYYYEIPLQLWDLGRWHHKNIGKIRKKNPCTKSKSTFGQCKKETSSKEYLPNLNS